VFVKCTEFVVDVVVVVLVFSNSGEFFQALIAK
jgi:hypothetical protein